MNFILSLFNQWVKKSGEAEWQEIQELKKKLISVGFASDEVNYMIQEQIGKKDLTELDRSEIRKVKQALSEQLEMSIKCLNLIKEK